MRDDRLARIDLNLLVALNALLTESSVTRAAARIGITQSAMSHALRRLRALFNDPLFARTPRGMVPTARAQQIAEPVQRILADVDRTIHGEPLFNPRGAQRSFTVVASDYSELMLLPPLFAHLSGVAPAVDVVVQNYVRDLALALEEGRADVLIGLFDRDARNAYRQRLFQERFVCLVRRGHPEVRRSLSLDQYVRLPHLLISPRGARPGGKVDEELARLGMQRRVALTVPHFLIAPHIVATSDMVVTVAERLGRIFADLLPLRIVDPPVELPEFTVSQYWHERQHGDPGHIWFRSTIAELCKGI